MLRVQNPFATSIFFNTFTTMCKHPKIPTKKIYIKYIKFCVNTKSKIFQKF